LEFGGEESGLEESGGLWVGDHGEGKLWVGWVGVGRQEGRRRREEGGEEGAMTFRRCLKERGKAGEKE